MEEKIRDPATKLWMRRTKKQMVCEAQRYGLPTLGTKLELAKRLAAYQEMESSRIWRAIAKGD